MTENARADAAAQQRYHELSGAVWRSLDLDAGMTDITNATRYASLRRSVARCLDLELGLDGALATAPRGLATFPPPAEERTAIPTQTTVPLRAAAGSARLPASAGPARRPAPAGPRLAERPAQARLEQAPLVHAAPAQAALEQAAPEHSPLEHTAPEQARPAAGPVEVAGPSPNPVESGPVPPAPASREPVDIPAELVVAAMAGDRPAVGELLALIRPLIVRYCRARLGWFNRSSVSADDVAQEVCLAVLTALPGYRDQGRPFLAFVYGIASHKVIDAHRAATRNRAEPVPEVPDRVESADGPEQRTLRIELSEEMGRLLEKLPEKQREILVLRTVVGLSAEKTAELVDSTPGAVRVAQHRALARLRKSIPGGRAGLEA